ncbi:hypothetical protein BU25DRAFT_433436 [Macroventuria anomochaeta]|uniref:Uncharacterized protein n=1 Tax=Macroventuria anomochaeta TaxID=301207 RepID=A0ACB6RRI1_9PLEO|nr:uncharacterized protein BU25DRAFT_433436 [Macroventuria anomochaeta]KAF2624506.1 hypothetical protein BU25DRAFT_433436 [Macroventuria anomochaeta]
MHLVALILPASSMFPHLMSCSTTQRSKKWDNDLATTYFRVQIKDYHGLPKDAPKDCSYFNRPYTHQMDTQSHDLSHLVLDRLPLGTKTAVKITTTVLDPGLYADPFNDELYLYGPMRSSCFTFRIGGKIDEEVRASHNIPSNWKARRKFFLDQSQLEKSTFVKGRMLLGFLISVAKQVDEETHHLRFMLKSRESGKVLFVVFFKLLFAKKLEDTLKNGDRAPSFQEPSGSKAPKSYTREDQSDYILNAAASTLAQSISAAFGAMGFGNSSDSENVNGNSTPYRSHAKPANAIDD